MSSLESIKSKIIDKQEVERLAYRAHFMNKKIVFTNGCFDILHRGHIEYLLKASEMGDILIVGLNSDASVRRLKGENRPIQDEETRALILASLLFVNYVTIFEEDTPQKLIELVQPNILVKGGDYTDVKQIVGYDIVTQRGGRVITLPYIEGSSTTEIIQKIHQL